MDKSKQETPRKRCILIADDEVGLRQMHQAFCEAIGCETLLAEDGVRAMEILNSGANVDVLITDRQMPNMDGDVLARTARQQYPKLPIIMVTTVGAQMLRTGEQPEGVDLVLPKPINIMSLREALAQVQGT